MGPAVAAVDTRQDLARQSGTAADVEDQRGRGQGQELQGAVRHVGLDGADAGGGGVFAGFGVVVEEVGGSVVVIVRRLGAEEGRMVRGLLTVYLRAAT